MRSPHGGRVAQRVAPARKSAHLFAVPNRKRGAQMFVRAVWRLRRLVDIKQALREMEVPTTRSALGLSGPDFQKMTRSLFDR
jgi:hypothetical protein